MIVFVGLGNPGPKYAHHRHNVGFMAIEAIRARHGFPTAKSGFQGNHATATFAGQKVLTLMPMTFMNESGRSVGEALRYFKADPKDVIVFHDELDLVPGKLRVKRGGGTGGHNGLKSLHAHIGDSYRRVRIGIGHPGHKDAVIGYVLRDFAKADAAWLDPLLESMAQHAALLATGDDAGFMNNVARDLPRETPASKDRPAPKDRPPHDNQTGQGSKPAASGAASLPAADAPFDKRPPQE